MGYLRPIKHEELAKWLVDNGLADEHPLYGRRSAGVMAAILIQEFDLIKEFKTPS